VELGGTCTGTGWTEGGGGSGDGGGVAGAAMLRCGGGEIERVGADEATSVGSETTVSAENCFAPQMRQKRLDSWICFPH